MDQQSVYSLSVLAADPDASEDSRTQIQAQLRDFILEFRLDNAFIYRYAILDRMYDGTDVMSSAEIKFAKTSWSSSTTATWTLRTSYPTTRS